MRQATVSLPRENSEALAVYLLLRREALGDLPEAVSKIAYAFDGCRTVQDICQEAQISENKGLAVVKKLSALGIIGRVSRGGSRTSMSHLEAADTIRGLPQLGGEHFNALEEAFFASEVQPIDECDLPFESIGDRVSSLISDLMIRVKGDLAY